MQGDEDNEVPVPAYPETHRFTIRLSDGEYEQLQEIAEFQWDFKISLNMAIKRMIREFFRGRNKRKEVKE